MTAAFQEEHIKYQEQDSKYNKTLKLLVIFTVYLAFYL